jgi:hypothetical protein
VVREDVLPEPMEIDMEVLGAISQPLTCREMVSALIVLKYSSSNSCVDRCRDVESSNTFFEKSLDWEKSFERETQGGIFSLKSAAGDAGLKDTLGEEGTIGKKDDVASSGSCRVRIGIGFLSIESSKVGVDVEIEVELSTWLHDGAEETSSFEVAKDGFDSSGMTLFWIGGEATDL